MRNLHWLYASALGILLLAGLRIGAAPSAVAQASRSAGREYVVLAWNDLGMHCYNRDFQDLAVLPPFNTLWAQVVHVGDPPEIVTTGIEVNYFFADNTYSIGKSNFWDYEDQLFGVNLPADVGLAGKGLSGEMDLAGDHFEAVGIPLTEYSDSDLVNRYPFQLATIVVTDASSGEELARITTVSPVSTEMRCDNCHYDGGLEDISTGRVETNILTLHDHENLDDYPSGHTGALMNRRPVLCAECHASNALGAPGVAGLPSLSKAMHDEHSFMDGFYPGLTGCYKCHPGPQTQCLRDVMSQKGMDCIDCHGSMETVSENPHPWLNEPRCDNAACHGSGYQQDQALYRMSKGHNGIYCEGCHDSTHAIAPSREANDTLKFLALQFKLGALDMCGTCHAVWPQDAGPHGLTREPPLFVPVLARN
jgi:hypothetical protein